MTRPALTRPALPRSARVGAATLALGLSLAACSGEQTSTGPAPTSEPAGSASAPAAASPPASPSPSVSASIPSGSGAGEFGVLPAAGAPLGLTLDASTGNVAIADFPDACTLLTTEQIKSILPSVTAVTTEGEPRRYTGIGVKGGVTPFPADCKYILDTPNNPDVGVVDWSINVDMNTLADPSYVKEQYDARKESAMRAVGRAAAASPPYPVAYEDLGSTLGGDEAFLDDLQGIVMRSGVALLYIDARLPGYTGEVRGAEAVLAAKQVARKKIAASVATTLAPRFK